MNEISQKDIYNFRPLADDQNWKAISIINVREIVISEDEANVFVKYEYAREAKSILIATKNNIGKKYPLTRLHTSKIELDKENKKRFTKNVLRWSNPPQNIIRSMNQLFNNFFHVCY